MRFSSVKKDALFKIISRVAEDPRKETPLLLIRTCENNTVRHGLHDLGAQENRPLLMEQFPGAIGEESVSRKLPLIFLFQIVVQSVG
jgi:hypothetical protein